MKKVIVRILLGVMFVINVCTTLFNLDIFMRFLKEKRKEYRREKRVKDEAYNDGYNACYADYMIGRMKR